MDVTSFFTFYLFSTYGLSLPHGGYVGSMTRKLGHKNWRYTFAGSGNRLQLSLVGMLGSHESAGSAILICIRLQGIATQTLQRQFASSLALCLGSWKPSAKGNLWWSSSTKVQSQKPQNCPGNMELGSGVMMQFPWARKKATATDAFTCCYEQWAHNVDSHFRNCSMYDDCITWWSKNWSSAWSIISHSFLRMWVMPTSANSVSKSWLLCGIGKEEQGM